MATILNENNDLNNTMNPLTGWRPSGSRLAMQHSIEARAQPEKAWSWRQIPAHAGRGQYRMRNMKKKGHNLHGHIET